MTKKLIAAVTVLSSAMLLSSAASAEIVWTGYCYVDAYACETTGACDCLQLPEPEPDYYDGICTPWCCPGEPGC